MCSALQHHPQCYRGRVAALRVGYPSKSGGEQMRSAVLVRPARRGYGAAALPERVLSQLNVQCSGWITCRLALGTDVATV